MRATGWIVLLAACGGTVSGGGGGGGGGGGADAPAGDPTALQFCVSETNRYRMTVPAPGTGAPRAPVTESAALEAYAATGAMYDFSHQPHDHFKNTSGGGIAFAENECPGQLGWTIMPGQAVKDVVGACVAAFYNGGPGEGHYENMMGPYASLGCGIYQQGNQITILQDFGN
jgi:hypothetical protein